MTDKKGLKMTLFMIVIPIIAIIITGIYILVTTNTMNSLTNESNTVNATVETVNVGLFWFPGTDMISVNYEIEDKDYTTMILIEKGTVKEGDTVTLLYNSKKPNDASTLEHCEYLLKTYKVEFIIVCAISALLIILRIVIAIVKKRKKRKSYDPYGGMQIKRNEKGEVIEVKTAFGTITQNPNYRK